MANATDIDQFYAQYFMSTAPIYGITEYLDEKDANGKQLVRCKTVKDTPSTALIGRHIRGEISVGLSPVGQGGTGYWGAIDIDRYHNPPMPIVRAIYDFNIPLCPCYSKSRGLHLFIFFTDAVPAENIRQLLNQYRIAFGLPKQTEIFPLARRAESNPGWINLPYYDAGNPQSSRKLVAREGTTQSLSVAVERFGQCRLSYKEHVDAYGLMPYSSAPPCVQIGALTKDIPSGTRNKWFFNLGVFLASLYKDDPDTCEAEILKVNESLQDPLPEKELRDTVFNVIRKGTYFYSCDIWQAEGMCDIGACNEREYGRGSKDMSGFTYGQLTQYMTNPPHYTWEVNGRILQGLDETLFLSQKRFQALCSRILHTAPRTLKENKWLDIVNKALTNLVTVEPDANAMIGKIDLARAAFLREYMQAVPGDHVSQVTNGRVVLDKERQVYLFSASDFSEWLLRYRRDIQLDAREVWMSCLQPVGVMDDPLNAGVSMIPVGKVPSVDVNLHIDYIEKETDEHY